MPARNCKLFARFPQNLANPITSNPTKPTLACALQLSSRATRYRNAEQFFASIEAGIIRDGVPLLYHTGIVMQLGLSAHLLDVGFDDQWCARHVGLHIDRSLALANATGLGLDEPQIERAAAFLSPYGKWRHADIEGGHTHLCSGAELRPLTRRLLDHVRSVTGHSRSARGRRCLD